MKHKLKYGIVFLVFASVAIVLFWQKSPEILEPREQKKSAPEAQERDSSLQGNLVNVPPVKNSLVVEQLAKIEREKGNSKLEKIKNIIKNGFNTPIDFWGKVVDQDGRPIVGAKSEIDIDAQGGNQKHIVFSDSDGLFELLGQRGASAYVKVYSDGYASTSDNKIGSNISSRMIYYSMEAMPAYAPPTKDNPQIFVLRKKNPLANLAHDFKKRVSVGKNGETQKIELKTERKAIGFEVRCWSSCAVPFTYDRYDWRAEIEIAGGKLQAITELEPVTAPSDGYQQVFQVEMPKDTQDNWLRSSPNGKRDFWIRFNDGTYAKARIEVKTGRSHEVDAEVWYNLDGTNNFEQ